MEYIEFMEKYDTEHYCCPVCHSRNYSSTLVAFAYDHNHPEEYKDGNSCKCFTCGWKGIHHKLVPKPEKTAYKVAILGKGDICKNYDNKLYSAGDARKLADELQKQDPDNYYYCYEVEIYEDIK